MKVLVSGYGVMTRHLLPHLLADTGLEVVIHSRHLTASPGGAVTLVDLATIPRTIATVILGCFESDERSREFWQSPEVVELISRQLSCCIELSTLSQGWIQEWHKHVRALGGHDVECPVTGSREGARAGQLSAFLYQPSQDLRASQVLSLFVRRIYQFQEPGGPARFKLLYNAWGATLLYTLKAFVPQFKELGADFATAIEILRSDGWMSQVVDSKVDRMLAQNFADPDFHVAHMIKDVRYASRLFDPVPELLDTVLGAYTAASAAYGDRADYTCVTGDLV